MLPVLPCLVFLLLYCHFEETHMIDLPIFVRIISEGIELMPVRYILPSVWVRLNIFSPLSIIQYVGHYVFSLPISLVMIERIYILCLIIIIKSEVWTITHCLGLGHETLVSAVCLFILFWVQGQSHRVVKSTSTEKIHKKHTYRIQHLWICRTLSTAYCVTCAYFNTEIWICIITYCHTL